MYLSIDGSSVEYEVLENDPFFRSMRVSPASPRYEHATDEEMTVDYDDLVSKSPESDCKIKKPRNTVIVSKDMAIITDTVPDTAIITDTVPDTAIITDTVPDTAIITDTVIVGETGPSNPIKV